MTILPNISGSIPSLKAKFDVTSIFPIFKNLVENAFQSKIVSVYKVRGGEFVALINIFGNNGINHLQTPPYTSQYNGTAERCHCHLVETGLTLLQSASLPSKFWSYAFQAAVYLINRLPTLVLKMSSPFFK